MKVFLNGILVTLTAAIATVSLSTLAGSEVSTARARIVEPVNIMGNQRFIPTSVVVNGITGDLLIRIAGAIAAAAQDRKFQPELTKLQAAMPDAFVGHLMTSQLLTTQLLTTSELIAASQLGTKNQLVNSTDLGQAPASGMLDGDPVSSIDLQAVYIDEAGQASLSVILAYN